MLAQIPLSEFSTLVINKSPAIGAADCWSAPKEAPVFARLARFLIRHRQPVRTAARLNHRYVIGHDPVLTTRSAGWATMFDEVGQRVERDLKLSEAISLPVVLLLLVVIFGGLVAAGVPLGMGLLAIVGTFLVLRTLAALTEVAVYSLSIATALGLG